MVILLFCPQNYNLYMKHRLLCVEMNISVYDILKAFRKSFVFTHLHHITILIIIGRYMCSRIFKCVFLFDFDNMTIFHIEKFVLKLAVVKSIVSISREKGTQHTWNWALANFIYEINKFQLLFFLIFI